MQIGCFVRTKTGFVGRIRTISLDVQVRLVPTGAEPGGTAPDWQVYGVEPADADTALWSVGAAWTHARKDGGSYLAVAIDCPTFARPLRAHLVPSADKADQHLLYRAPSRARRTEGPER
ncbi:hypothetical protein NVSP9465_01469 [Novosphingobium sp. CECT 9465]|nr:hypothetical protein NVSP9465_01469 [Novosphingobium sp. CECT 9465]